MGLTADLTKQKNGLVNWKMNQQKKIRLKLKFTLPKRWKMCKTHSIWLKSQYMCNWCARRREKKDKTDAVFEEILQI